MRCGNQPAKNLNKKPRKQKTMKMTLSTYQIADALKNDTCARWSYAGSLALAEYLEELEESTGEEMELDTCAIRCDFSEYESALECAVEYGWSHEADILDADDNLRPDDEVLEENEELALRWLQNRTQVIEFDGGVIIYNF
jgi:hypothetical protein